MNFPPDTLENINCIMKNYESSLCGNGCNCNSICKNRKALNIIKLAFMIKELELLESNQYEFQRTMAIYKPIIKILCQCK